jgi:hypothetical protein
MEGSACCSGGRSDSGRRPSLDDSSRLSRSSRAFLAISASYSLQAERVSGGLGFAQGRGEENQNTYHRTCSRRCIHSTTILRRALTLVAGRRAYLSFSAIGNTLASQ